MLIHSTMLQGSGLFLSRALTYQPASTQDSYKNHGVRQARQHELQILYELAFKLF